jgi:Zn-dependent protease
MTAVTPTTTFPCQRCGMVLFHGNLVCPSCGALVYADTLNDVAARAQAQEAAGHALAAAMIWREALQLLPPASQQYQSIAQRIGMLTSRFSAGITAAATAPAPAPAPAKPGASAAGFSDEPIRPPPLPKNDPWRLALAKTLGSMLVSIVVYTALPFVHGGMTDRLQFATGFVLLMLVHELGHSIAMRYFKLSASPPIFIPFLGAVINLRQMPRNALEEAIVGIGGPITGTLAAGVTYLIYLKTGSELFLRLSQFGFLLNLFNMLPVPPLDGGRVTAAVSPWVWIIGLILVVLYMALDWLTTGQFNFILILLLFMAWPRVQRVLTSRDARRTPYYDIGLPAKWAMGMAYVGLSGVLAVMYFLCQWEAAHRFGSGLFG